MKTTLKTTRRKLAIYSLIGVLGIISAVTAYAVPADEEGTPGYRTECVRYFGIWICRAF